MPRSIIPPACVHEKARRVYWGVRLNPTIWPLSLTAATWLSVPPRVPRSMGTKNILSEDPALPATAVKRTVSASRSTGGTTRKQVRIGCLHRTMSALVSQSVAVSRCKGFHSPSAPAPRPGASPPRPKGTTTTTFDA